MLHQQDHPAGWIDPTWDKPIGTSEPGFLADDVFCPFLSLEDLEYYCGSIYGLFFFVFSPSLMIASCLVAHFFFRDGWLSLNNDKPPIWQKKTLL